MKIFEVISTQKIKWRPNILKICLLGFGVVVERSTSVCVMVGAMVVSSIPHMAEILSSHIYSQQ